ncbi:asparagine synthase-related protein [Streptomyces spongiae]|uniref:asparagine synthase (glutamine-hydrolyzing) n=1 Tax=Streptomyces spongiae TaxID=565072 RepID=A0A5N8X8I5_9ACTN|nr:asparagine synthase-related protein [Streptomyces spongiae]MPY55800.1 hypothetical protein [Streptomyces spongiae]
MSEPVSAEMTFTVLPDDDRAAAAARLVCATPGAQVIPHASGRPWLVGRWPAGAVKVAAVGRTRVAVAGFCPVAAGRLERAAGELGDLSGLDRLALRLPGSAHLIGSFEGRVRVQGTASGVRAVFHTRLARVTVAADRPDTLAELIGADVDESLLALRLLTPWTPYPLRETPVWRAVRQVPPDHWLHLAPDGSERTVHWWSPPEPALTVEQGAPAVRDALTQAVHARVTKSEVVSTDLSGGMDSGTVAHLAAGACRHLVTVRTPQRDPGGDDALWAGRSVERLPDAEHVVLAYAQSPTMWAGLQGGGPGTTLPAEPPYWVRAGARFADVVRAVAARDSGLHLCGHGGDELFQVPGTYLHTLTRTRPWTALRHVRGRRALAHWPFAATWRALADSRSFADWLAHSARQLGHPHPSPRVPQLGWTPPLRLPPWTTAEAARAVDDLLHTAAQRRPEPLAAGRDAHLALDGIRQKGAVIRYAERLMAAHGVRLAAPYLDDRVIEAALAVRPDERGTPDRYKPLLAEAMRGLVPDDLLGRATKGHYGEDTHDGLRRNRAVLLALFDDSELAARGLVDDTAVRAALRATHADPTPLMALEPTLACEVWLRSLSRGSKPSIAPATEGAA